jgi:NADPH:quinone reductase-like Zn-dependent oxidoreductase
MKAIVLREFGGPEVLHYEDVPIPRPSLGEILVKVYSVSVNRTLDLVVRAGKYPVKIQMPHILGVDPAGEVVEVGEGVKGFKSGDRVAVVSFIACRECKQCLKGGKRAAWRAVTSAFTAGADTPNMSLSLPVTHLSCRIMFHTQRGA